MDIWQFNGNHSQNIDYVDQLPKNGFIWIDAGKNEVLQVIKKTEQLTGYYINERHVDDCLNLNHPCFYDSVQAYDVLIFRSLISDQVKDCTETKPIAFLIFNNLLVSFNSHDHAINRLKTKLQSTRKKLPDDPILLLFLLLDEVIDNFLDLRAPLLDRYTYWQQKLFLDTKQQLNWLEFLNYKTEIRKLRTLSEDQLEVVYQWRQDNELGITEQLTIRFNDLSDHIRRIMRYATQLESDLDTLIEIFYSLIGNRTNDVVRILTVLSAIFLPLNLIAGIFGMNFQKMRILQLSYGLDVALIGMALLAVILFGIFKWKEWI